MSAVLVEHVWIYRYYVRFLRASGHRDILSLTGRFHGQWAIMGNEQVSSLTEDEVYFDFLGSCTMKNDLCFKDQNNVIEVGEYETKNI